MIEIKNKVVYKAFGLHISSDIALPELPAIQPLAQKSDVDIESEPHAPFRFELEAIPYKHVVEGNAVMVYIPDTAYFRISEGNRITVASVPGADEDLIRLYILGTCMGALLMQRRMMPLHGSAIAIDGKAYAFVGESGAGKSTLASAFLNQGYPLLSDDLIAVSLSEQDGTAYVTPAFPQQKLWEDSLHQLGRSTDPYRSIYGRETKFSVPVTSNYFAEPLPLAGVFELVKTEEERIDLRPIPKLDRLQTLYCHTFRQFLIPRLGLMEWHFQISAALIQQIRMYQLRRPAAGFTAPQLISRLLDSLSTEES
ncbi:aldolase [Paenibacillus rigui]|uniref:Aldolase n=1 Tax=Paenibacillus rigui TaxID=554312 RepID=A0A229UPK7_9BACL|nr:aldolase [Paenibacillus rigui]OXM85211.1 aldolase [Paenibacillus rigui]